MHVDGRAVVLAVNEARCQRDCVSPGVPGVRVFHFRTTGVRATLRKHVGCPRDAEVCAGLPEGRASLTVATSKGRTVLAVRNEYCDL